MARKPLTKARKAPSQQRSAATVEALLAATARVLVRDGYDHASTNRIAEAAGVSVGSLYQYFPSKEALVAALVERHLQKRVALIQGLAAELQPAPVAVAMRRVIAAVVEVQYLEAKIQRIIIEQVPRVLGLGRLQELDHVLLQLLRSHLEAHRDELDVTDIGRAAYVVFHAIQGATLAPFIDPPEDSGVELPKEAVIEEVTRLALRYLLG